MKARRALAPLVLLGSVLAVGVAVAAWKADSQADQARAAASQPEPVETVTAATARLREHVRTTTSIGTVLALQSVELRNELAGTVREVALVPGAIVEQGTVLVALDVAVEQAELAALEAKAELARTVLRRTEQASAGGGVSDVDVDRARSELDVAQAEVERARAVIERKTVRAPFRARVGMADIHPGQYLEEGTRLTTLQGVDDAVHVDFTVAQEVAARLAAGGVVRVVAGEAEPVPAAIEAIDARVDVETRNAWVRARLEGVPHPPSPGSSVRVLVPVGEPGPSVVVPVSALRTGPEGDHVFVLAPDDAGRLRARVRAVRSGAVLDDEVVIEEGLDVGETVAASGSFKLRDGLLVTVSGPPAAGGAP